MEHSLGNLKGLKCVFLDTSTTTHSGFKTISENVDSKNNNNRRNIHSSLDISIEKCVLKIYQWNFVVKCGRLKTLLFRSKFS